MRLHTSAGSIWPVRLAYAAAFAFIAASGATNLLYGWNKGTDLGSSLVWAIVSLGVSIIFALSWPAFMRAADEKHHARAVLILIGLLLSGSYSISAALGSAYGSRVQAASEETDRTNSRAKAQAAYNNAKAELDALAPALTAAELEPQIRTLRATKGANNCERRDGPVSRKVCAEVDELEAQAARATRRDQLAATMREASEKLSDLPAGKVANADAVAISTFLTGIGLPVSVDRVNKLLVLLAVLVIECGGGVSLAIGMSLSSAAPSGVRGHVSGEVVSGRTEMSWTPSDTLGGYAPEAESVQEDRCSEHVTRSVRPAPDIVASSVSGVRLLDFIRDEGGVLTGGQRAMARTLGWSKSRLHDALHDLAHAGLIKLTTGKTGTVVQLVAG